MIKYTGCGLENIYLKNGYIKHSTEEGDGISVYDMDALHRVIAKGIVEKPAPLSGKEFRFLRIEMDLSQKAMGDLMDKSDQMIAKWEKGENDIPVLADAAIRNLYMEDIGESPLVGLLKKLKDLDRQYHEAIFELEERESIWLCANCG